MSSVLPPTKTVSLSHDEAVEVLTKRLWQKLEHCDPGDGDWEGLPDETRDIYRHSVEFLLAASDDLITTARMKFRPNNN